MSQLTFLWLFACMWIIGITCSFLREYFVSHVMILED